MAVYAQGARKSKADRTSGKRRCAHTHTPARPAASEWVMQYFIRIKGGSMSTLAQFYSLNFPFLSLPDLFNFFPRHSWNSRANPPAPSYVWRSDKSGPACHFFNVRFCLVLLKMCRYGELFWNEMPGCNGHDHLKSQMIIQFLRGNICLGVESWYPL